MKRQDPKSKETKKEKDSQDGVPTYYLAKISFDLCRSLSLLNVRSKLHYLWTNRKRRHFHFSINEPSKLRKLDREGGASKILLFRPATGLLGSRHLNVLEVL